MIKAKIKKKGSKLSNIKASIKKIDKQKTQAGYFSEQGMHIDGQYSYVALAQALELGYFPKKGLYQPRMRFMNSIGMLARRNLKNSPRFNGAFKYWSRRLHKGVSPKRLLDAAGSVVIDQTYKVFNNPYYFPQTPENKTPIFETGDLRDNFSYKTTWDNKVRRT